MNLSTSTCEVCNVAPNVLVSSDGKSCVNECLKGEVAVVAEES